MTTQSTAIDTETELYKEFQKVISYFMAHSFDAAHTLHCTDPENPELNGETSFIRHWGIHRLTLNVLNEIQTDEFGPAKILVAPASIGCEAYALSSFVPSHCPRGAEIDTFDCSKTFTRLARLGAYTHEALFGLDGFKDDLFDEPSASSFLVPIKDAVRQRVHIMDPMRFEDFRPPKNYDAVVLNNLFQYLDPKDATGTLSRIMGQKPAIFIASKHTREAPTHMSALQDFMSATGYLNTVEGFEVDPVWKRTSLAPNGAPFSSVPFFMKHYHIWARPHI